MTTLAAVILAGGISQRMGQDKALLEIDGTCMLRRTWNIAQALTSEVWVVTSRVDRYRPLLPTTTQWVSEPPPAANMVPAGPLVAFAQVLRQVNTDWVLLLPCDLPALQTDVLDQWKQALPQVAPDKIAYLPRHPKGWEPLCGFYRGDCLSNLQAYVATGGRSFQHWLDQQNVQTIPNVPSEMLVNCNTPADWAQFRDRLK